MKNKIDEKNLNKKNKKRGGFTLPEVLISMGLFSVIISVTSAIFIIGLRSQRQIIAAINANDNLSFAMEVMARDIRTGQLFFSSREDEISFLNHNKKAVIYRLNNQTIEKSTGGESFIPLTSNNIRVEDLKFKLVGEGRYDDEQILITMIMKVISQFGNQEISQNIQTTISPRQLEAT